MEFTTHREGKQKQETNRVVIYIGIDTYRISESVDGKMCINKTSDLGSDSMSVHPRSGNEIELS
jgi:hypothetical protein